MNNLAMFNALAQLALRLGAYFAIRGAGRNEIRLRAARAFQAKVTEARDVQTLVAGMSDDAVSDRLRAWHRD